MTLRVSRPLVASALVAVALGGVALVAFFRSVDAERQAAEDRGRVVVRSETLAAPDFRGVTLWLPHEPARDVEPFAGRVYVATSAGLAVFEADGRFVRRYTTADGLPENALTCLARYDGKLYVGTSDSGLLAFDGDRFVRFTFEQPRASKVSALRATGGELVVGTFDAGLFEYDGANFSRRYADSLGAACEKVTAVAAVGPRLYVGTFSEGLFEWREGVVDRIGRAEGLPSARVVSIAETDGGVAVATDLGTSFVRDGHARLADSTPNATGVASRAGGVYVSSLGRGVTNVSASAGAMVGVAERPHSSDSAIGIPSKTAYGIKAVDGALWAFTDDGLFACPQADGPTRFERFGDDAAGETLSTGHVSALSIDPRGRLAVGYFDGGIDLLDRESGARVGRLDDADVREVNALVSDPTSGRTLAATSAGVVALDGAGGRDVTGREKGLAGDGASSVCAFGQGIAVGTNAGVTIFDGRVGRTVTAFQGLPNNHTYAVAARDDALFVGTLGGLAQIEGLRVSRVYSAANSRLPHNWVNALALVDGRLFVGTYGGGVAELSPRGDVVRHEDTAGLDVNPGAMLVVGNRLYVGTLSRGAWVLDLQSGHWSEVGAGLATTDVTALAADQTYVYFGTEHGVVRVERGTLS